MLRPDVLFRQKTLLSATLLSVAIAGGVLNMEALKAQAVHPAADRPAPTTYLPNALPSRARVYLGVYWGIDSLSVKWVESGELIRFSYRVIDGERAKPLNDKKSEPFLVAPSAHARLVVPSLEKVGQLRQSSTPEVGKVYWMAFSNAGKLVKRGDHVNVVIGQFHMDGLVVE